MSAPRTPRELEFIVNEAVWAVGRPDEPARKTIAAACVEHAANETARLRAAGEALADALGDITSANNIDASATKAALAAWREALGVEVAR